MGACFQMFIRSKRSVLHMASVRGHYDLVVGLMMRGVEVNGADEVRARPSRPRAVRSWQRHTVVSKHASGRLRTYVCLRFSAIVEVALALPRRQPTPHTRAGSVHGPCAPAARITRLSECALLHHSASNVPSSSLRVQAQGANRVD